MMIARRFDQFAAMPLMASLLIAIVAASPARAAVEPPPTIVCELTISALGAQVQANQPISDAELEWGQDFAQSGNLKVCERPPLSAMVRALAARSRLTDPMSIEKTEVFSDYLRRTEPLENHYQIGLDLATGKYGEGDADLAIDWISHAAEIGDPGALLEIAGAYADGILNFPKDSAKALAYEQRAAEAGSAAALYQLGIRYFVGQGVKKDAKQAEKLMQQSAALGQKEAAAALAYAYNGDPSYGLGENIKLGRTYAEIAANAGDPDMMAMYAGYLMSSSGNYKKEDEVFYWLNKAADSGSEKAKQFLASKDSELRALFKRARERRAAQTAPLRRECDKVQRNVTYKDIDNNVIGRSSYMMTDYSRCRLIDPYDEFKEKNGLSR